MGLLSNTGLLATVPCDRYGKTKNNDTESRELIMEKAILSQLCEVTPAPFMLRPYAGLYNPYSDTCSVLCNHPADKELKHSVRIAKDALPYENRAYAYPEDCSSYSRFPEDVLRTPHDIVTEDMFKRYTETDSRPLTPAPTLASGKSRGSRRCLTPDHPYPRTTIVVDLRRSHSQETIYYHGYKSDNEKSTLPSVNVSDGGNAVAKSRSEQFPLTAAPVMLLKRPDAEPINTKNARNDRKAQLKALNLGKPTKGKTKQVGASQRAANGKRDKREDKDKKDRDASSEPTTQADDAESVEVRRRGRRRRKGRAVGSDRLTSAGLAAQSQPDPETQVAGIGTDSNNNSSRGSISGAPPAVLLTDDEIALLPTVKKPVVKKTNDSFLDDEILKFLHREVDEEAIETEFDTKRRYVLKEALRTRPDRQYGQEMQSLLKELKVPNRSLGDWLHIPRVFSRQNAQFALPMYKDLEWLTPMQYVARFVTLKKSKQMLYLTVLRKYRPESYRMPKKNIEEGLILMMGGELTTEQVQKFKVTMDWDNYEEENNPDEIWLKSLEEGYNKSKGFKGSGDSEEEANTIKFRTWCGLCAVCERMFGRFPPRERDPPDGIEMSDFTNVEAKLSLLKAHSGLVEIISVIKNR